MADGFVLVAGLLWLDLVNTEPVRDGARVDLLPGFPELVRWLRATRVLSETAARRALARWGGTIEGEQVWQEAVALRAALREGAERLAAGRPVGDAMIDAVNRILAARPAVTRLVRTGGGYVTRSEAVGAAAIHLLLPIAESAAWLL